MIVLDPDLDPDPAPATAAKFVAPDFPANLKTNRVPSARTLARFLSEAQTAVRLRGQVSVLLTTDVGIARLNRRFRGKNKATDVLSFPAGPVHGGAIAGDLAISVPTALRQAAEQGHSLAVEIKVLMLHGLLHLAGYDHEMDDGKMARRERLLRRRLGLPQGLIERTEGPTPADRKSIAKSPSGAKALASSGRPSVRAKARTLQPGEAETPMQKKAEWVPPVSILRPGRPRNLMPAKLSRTTSGRSAKL